jgi:hypothetical protein
MNHQTQGPEKKRADMLSGVLPVVAILFVVTAIFGFLRVGWFAGLCLLGLALIFFSLGAILDLQLEISRGSRRLESKIDKPADK